MINQFIGPYSFLSNDYLHNLVIYDLTFCSVSHYICAMKTTSYEDMCIMSQSTDPIKDVLNFPHRTDWDDVKLSIMEYAIYYKFCEPSLANLLKSTQTIELIDGYYDLDESNTDKDFWSYNLRTNVGQNNIGKLLMKIRSFLISQDIYSLTYSTSCNYTDT